MRKLILNFPDSVPIEQISLKFVQGMFNRMAFGFHNYGPVQEGFPQPHDAIKNLKLRLKKYRETANTEWLMDAANYAMIEFMHPKLRGAHFRATSKAESPGSVRSDGSRVKDKTEDKQTPLKRKVSTPPGHKDKSTGASRQKSQTRANEDFGP